jgi:ribosomal protein S3
VQVKGRMSGKGGMTSKRVWTWGRTSAASISDPVDYAHEAVVTRAGYIGIKVRAVLRLREARHTPGNICEVMHICYAGGSTAPGYRHHMRGLK